ncbi:hypothetical protein PG997_014668 [Apiospora hydei]|uniref:Uncharacterized protein n=1 Tax=Apiospora hydei TaxID=1337664 RepID=A0ABR1UX04_9PEZI
MGAEVRHVGSWNGTTVSADGVAKRSDDDFGRSDHDHEVFGVRMPDSGRDLHFATTPRDDGHLQLRIGFGPGPMTANNRRWVKRNGLPMAPTTTRPVDHYFTQGGFDMLVRTDAGGETTNERPDAKDPAWQKRWRAMWECYFGAPDAKTGEFPPSWESPGLWFSVVDDKAKGTVVAGAMAPFAGSGEGERSLITSMTLEGGGDIERDDQCNGAGLDVDEPWVPEHDGL